MTKEIEPQGSERDINKLNGGIEQVKAELDIVVCRYCGKEIRGDGFISANQFAGEAGWELEGNNLWTCPGCQKGDDINE